MVALIYGALNGHETYDIKKEAKTWKSHLMFSDMYQVPSSIRTHCKPSEESYSSSPPYVWWIKAELLISPPFIYAGAKETLFHSKSSSLNKYHQKSLPDLF